MVGEEALFIEILEQWKHCFFSFIYCLNELQSVH